MNKQTFSQMIWDLATTAAYEGKRCPTFCSIQENDKLVKELVTAYIQETPTDAAEFYYGASGEIYAMLATLGMVKNDSEELELYKNTCKKIYAEAVNYCEDIINNALEKAYERYKTFHATNDLEIKKAEFQGHPHI